MKQVAEFLKRHWDQKSPLLLACSGGTDSKALLYVLYESRVNLHVAHVDHGWRAKSAEEAEKLKKEVASLGYPFHSTRLVPSGKNREAAARQKRIEFFRSLFEKFPFQALLLAHQAEDLAETVLKRILEGAHLSSAGGMQSLSHLENLPVWRPMLSVKKAEILSFLKEKALTPFLDPTNSDPAYLRSRLREEIFPFLSRSFGKETVGNLVCFSERAYELKEYLERKTASIPRSQGPWGTALFLQGVERLEARYLLKKYVRLSRPVLEKILDWVKEGRPKRKISTHIFVDRGTVLLLSSEQNSLETREIEKN